MKFSSFLFIFVLIKLEHIFHGRDFGFGPEKNPLRMHTLFEEEGVC